jgi:hypothetical protein
MDYHQITERYKKRELRNQFTLVVWLIITAMMLWAGWFLGNSQQLAVVALGHQQLTNLTQQNEQLLQRLVTVENQFITERERRIAAELEIDQGQQKVEIRRLKQIMARHLSRGISEDQIRLALQSVSKPSRCRSLEEKDVAVATEFFAGKEANTDMINGSIKVFIEGEAGQKATKDRPWFDPQEEVTMRVGYLSGEKIAAGHLPITMNIIADSWLLKFDVVEAALNGYVNVKVGKCSLN